MSDCTAALLAATRDNKKGHSLVHCPVAHTTSCRKCHAQLIRFLADLPGCRCFQQSWPCSNALFLNVHLSITKVATTGPVPLSKQYRAFENDFGSNVCVCPAAAPYQMILMCAVDWRQLRSQLVFQHVCRHDTVHTYITHAFTACSLQMDLLCANTKRTRMQHSLIHCLQHPDGLLPPLVVLLSLQVFGKVDLRVKGHEASQLQGLAALMKPPNFVALNRPLWAHTS